MANISDKSKVLYLFILIIFIAGVGIFWLDHIGMVDLNTYMSKFKSEPELVIDAEGDEPSLIAREEFEKEKQKLLERIEDLDKREAIIAERENELKANDEKLEEMKKGLELEKKKFSQGKKKYSGYKQNIRQLANKIANMPPADSVKIMVNWEDPLIIDVIRQMDADAEEAGRASITSYLITLLPKEKASRIMYLMTQL